MTGTRVDNVGACTCTRTHIYVGPCHWIRVLGVTPRILRHLVSVERTHTCLTNTPLACIALRGSYRSSLISHSHHTDDRVMTTAPAIMRLSLHLCHTTCRALRAFACFRFTPLQPITKTKNPYPYPYVHSYAPPLQSSLRLLHPLAHVSPIHSAAISLPSLFSSSFCPFDCS